MTRFSGVMHRPGCDGNDLSSLHISIKEMYLIYFLYCKQVVVSVKYTYSSYIRGIFPSKFCFPESFQNIALKGWTSDAKKIHEVTPFLFSMLSK